MGRQQVRHLAFPDDNTYWILSYRISPQVWHTHVIQAHDVELIQAARELRTNIKVGPKEYQSNIHPAHWVAAVIEPPVDSTATGWSFGDLTDYQWRNLGQAYDDSVLLGL